MVRPRIKAGHKRIMIQSITRENEVTKEETSNSCSSIKAVVKEMGMNHSSKRISWIIMKLRQHQLARYGWVSIK